MADKNIMAYENTLPADFTGVFYFTNPSDEEFIGTWNKKEYHFAPNSTSPMIMPEHSPLEIQHIRKKFAKDLAEREFFKTKQYEGFRRQEGEKIDGFLVPRLSGLQQAATYTLDTLTPYIQQCLKPLEQKRAFVSNAPRTRLENVISRDDETGELNTVAVDKKLSLKDRAYAAQGLPQDPETLNAPPTQDDSNPVTIQNDAP